MKKSFGILLFFTSLFCFADVKLPSVPASSVLLLDGSNPMQNTLDMAGNDIANADISAVETDPGAWKKDGSTLPTATMDGGNQDFTNFKSFEMDPGSGAAYKFSQVFSQSIQAQSTLGGAFLNLVSQNDAGTQHAFVSLARRSGTVSGPGEYFQLGFRPFPDWYELSTIAFSGGDLKPIVIDHGTDGTPEWRWEINGEASAENNPLNNLSSIEIDPGSGTKFTVGQLFGVGTKLEFKPNIGDGRFTFSSALDNGSQDNYIEVARRAGISGGARETLVAGYKNSDDSFYLGTEISGGGFARNLNIGVNGTNVFRISSGGLIDALNNPIQGVGTPSGPSFATPKSYVDSFVFGNEVQTAESLAVSTTTLGTYQTKLQLITASLPAGDYYIAWSADIGNTNSNGTTSLRFLLDGATTTNEADNANGWAAGGYMAAGGHTVQTFTVGARTLAIQYLAGSQTAQIRNARIAIWRIN